MEKEEMARQYGFETYKEMLENSFTVIYDHGVSWLATITHDGWLAWVDKYPGQSLGFFNTYDETSRYLHNVFKELNKTMKCETSEIFVNDRPPNVLN